MKNLSLFESSADFFGIPSARLSFSHEEIHINRIVEVKIVEHRALRYDLAVMMQLGWLVGWLLMYLISLFSYKLERC